MKTILLIMYWVRPAVSFSQDLDTSANSKNTAIQYVKPAILNSGFIDIVNNGQVSASARLIRVFIGEPGKFVVPLSVYSGVSANNFQNNQSTLVQKNNDQLVTGFINPLSGLINLSIESITFFKKSAKLTRTAWLNQCGIRILTGFKTGIPNDPQTGRPVNFLNSFAVSGLYFQTGAWEKNNSKNMGIFWSSIRYIGCFTSPDQIRNFLTQADTNGIYYGYSLGGGIEINNLLDIKILYYRYNKKPEIDYTLPIYQFSFNYAIR